MDEAIRSLFTKVFVEHPNKPFQRKAKWLMDKPIRSLFTMVFGGLTNKPFQ